MLCIEITIGRLKNTKNAMNVLKCVKCAEDVECLINSCPGSCHKVKRCM